MHENRKVDDLLLPLPSKAVSNAKRLAQGDLTDLELLRSPADIQRRRTVLNQARQHLEDNFVVVFLGPFISPSSDIGRLSTAP